MVSIFPNMDALDNCLGRMTKSFLYFQDKQKVRYQIKAPISQWISSLHIYHIKQKCNYFNPWNKYCLNSWTKLLMLFLAVPLCLFEVSLKLCLEGNIYKLFSCEYSLLLSLPLDDLIKKLSRLNTKKLYT